MRLGSIASEARQNVLSGTTRALLLTLILGVLAGAIAVAEARTIEGIDQRVSDFVAAGGNIHIIRADGAVNPAKCENLTPQDGARHSGALREGPTLHPLALPGSTLIAHEVSPGFVQTIRASSGATPVSGLGSWVSTDLLESLGLVVGETLVVAEGRLVAGGTFETPTDGRARTLAYSALSPVPPQGQFDECWVSAPPSWGAEAVNLRVVLDPGVSPDAVEMTQYNPTLGERVSRADLLAQRPTRLAWLWAIVAGAGLGLGATMARRLELTLAMSLGVTRTALFVQVALKSAAWVLLGSTGAIAAVVLSLPGEGLASAGETSPLALAVSCVAIAGASGVLGSATACLWLRESSLYRLFKSR